MCKSEHRDSIRQKKLRELDIKPKAVFDKIVSEMKSLEVKDGDESIIIKPKEKI